MHGHSTSKSKDYEYNLTLEPKNYVVPIKYVRGIKEELDRLVLEDIIESSNSNMQAQLISSIRKMEVLEWS